MVHYTININETIFINYLALLLTVEAWKLQIVSKFKLGFNPPPFLRIRQFSYISENVGIKKVYLLKLIAHESELTTLLQNIFTLMKY